MADGYITDSHNSGVLDRIGFGQKESEINSLYKFCDAIGLSKDKVKGPDKDNFYRVRFGCQPMIRRLLEIGWQEFKHGAPFPFASNLKLPLYKAFILGFYDGDGWKTTSAIGNTN